MSDIVLNLTADLKRVRKDASISSFISAILFNHSFKYMFWFRLGTYAKQYSKYKFFYYICTLVINRLSYRYGIQMPIGTSVNSGLFFPHFSSIVISVNCKIGTHVTVLNGVTIGSTRGGAKGGCPIVGDYVVIGDGAKIIGNVRIGNNVFIGANAVVVKDVPDNAVVGGVPAKILNMNGIEKTSYY